MTMNRRALLVAAAATGVASAVQAQPDTDGMADLLDHLRSEAGIPALSGAVVTPDGIAWLGVTGVRQSGGSDPVTSTDRWHLGSNTKAMTAALYARLVEQGRASWDAPLRDLFADLTVDPTWDAVTIGHLFRHRAGILDPAVMPVWMMTAWGDADVSELRSSLARTVLGAPPAGELDRFAYSNAGYILAGAAIERLTGAPWETTLRQEVFEPLGLTSAGFAAPTGDNAWGHQGAGLRPKDPAVRGSDNPPALGPAGTAHASMQDYARFLRVFLNGGDGWLSTDSLAVLTAPGPQGSPAYACGWGVITGPAWTGGAPALTHDGSNTLWLARAVVVPAKSTALICVANAADPAESAIQGLTRSLIERFLA